MAKVKFNVKGVEVRKGGGEPIPKGVYECEIESCDVTTPQGKDQRIEVVYKITDGDHKGRKLFDYINLVSESAAWKLREFLETFGLASDKKEAGEFDTTKLVGKTCNVRVVHQPGQAGTQYEGTVNSRVGGTFAIDAEEQEEDLSDESEDEKDDEDGDEVDLDELDRAELKKLIKEQELGIAVKKAWSDDELRQEIAAALGEDEEDESEDEDEDEDEDEEGNDYESMSVDELKETLKERGLKAAGSKKIMIARLEKDDEDGDDGEPF